MEFAKVGFCDTTDLFLCSNAIDFVHETKYLGVMLNSQFNTSIDVFRQTWQLYARANMLLRNFRYCSVDVKCMLFRSYCTNMYCCPLWFNSTSTCSSIKKLKASYNGVLRRLLLIVKPYSASEMFVTHNIPSFYELLSKCIYSFRERISHSANKIIKACLSPIVIIHQADNGGDQYCIHFNFIFFSIVIIICNLIICILYMDVNLSEIKNIIIICLKLAL